MGNWIKFFLVFFLALTAALSTFVFYKAYQPVSQWKNQAEQKVLAAGLLEETDRAEVFNGTEAWTVVYGKDGAGTEKAVFVSREAGAGKDMKEIVLKKGVTAKQAVDTVKNEKAVRKLLHVKLGMEDDEPIWEVVFKNDAGKLNYVYVSFTDGKWQKRISNL
ncbi:DUF5590 domain-containing protein [Sporosarcina koreensis]|uniref:cell wall elongation regulator TseB-like domain-containing protein n=1 Tax=Sporosarcina koreensis TaxID=334735 RepID=UPI00058EEF25|nr:DUF5590 domain-containing protein [Sporosarcina koreensis]